MKGWALLAVIWAAIAVLWYFSVGVPKADGQAALAPEASPFLTACAIARASAATEHLSIYRCRKVAEVVDGNEATVTVQVWVSGYGKFNVATTLLRSEWGMTSLKIAPSG